ncbi:hypothetical protein POTOM_059865 [Populus tomentosa]|uniref:Uncharacterized protein n=1 Tax=Populus tomentosa TaxID=118781 RepID=A0A8X7Y0X7_POPTO|nr:hypothetical protein POTOM_059865 [Populus tomentosa]
MSGYENVVGGKLKLKGKALDVKAGSLKKKKKKHVKKQVDSSDLVIHNELSTGQSVEEPTDDPNEEDINMKAKRARKERLLLTSIISHLQRDDTLSRERELMFIGWRKKLINLTVTGFKISTNIWPT